MLVHYKSRFEWVLSSALRASPDSEPVMKELKRK